jgi:hypothetical protein
MEKVKKFFTANKYALIWTACYVAVMFLILLLLFGFNLFSLSDWSILLKARLRGFAGFAFGILLLAALPMYIATTLIIVRTKKPLFSIVPEKEEKKDANQEEKPEEKEPDVPLSVEIPAELKGAFLRARQNVAARPESAFDAKDSYNNADAAQPAAGEPEAPAAGLPLPDDFDFSAAAPSAPSAPVFKEISFGGPADEIKEAEQEEETRSPLTERLEKYGYAAEGGIVIANGLAIATHDDPDFWITDGETWFAAGKQKASPISEAIAAAQKHDATPAIYLAAQNIMDLDAQVEQWESSGVRVIKSLEEL